MLSSFYFYLWYDMVHVEKIDDKGGSKNLERLNIQQSIFLNFEIVNIKTARDELSQYFISDRPLTISCIIDLLKRSLF